MSLMTNKNRTIEELIELFVPVNTKVLAFRFTPPEGMVLRAVLGFDNPVPNPGFVRFYLNDQNGIEIIKPQNIQLMRSREVEYENDGKTINLTTEGHTFIAGILCEQNMTADFYASLVLVYEPAIEECNTAI